MRSVCVRIKQTLNFIYLKSSTNKPRIWNHRITAHPSDLHYSQILQEHEGQGIAFRFLSVTNQLINLNQNESIKLPNRRETEIVLSHQQ